MIEVVPTRASHIRPVVSVLRDADRFEVECLSGRSALSVIAESFRRSDRCWTVLVDGKPEMIFGVGTVSVIGSVACPWLVGSDIVPKKHTGTFLTASREFVSVLQAKYSTLQNLVHAENRESVRWLKWLGFELSEPFDICGQKFKLFRMGEQNV